MKIEEILVKIKGRKIERIFNWKVHYDKMTKKACGLPSPTTGHLICVADADAQDKSSILPMLQNKPHWIEDREAIMIILAPKKERKRKK
jgi:hypothetical protein